MAAGPNAAAFRTYPGRFKSLIGVGRGAFEDPEALRSELTLDHEIVAPGRRGARARARRRRAALDRYVVRGAPRDRARRAHPRRLAGALDRGGEGGAARARARGARRGGGGARCSRLIRSKACRRCRGCCGARRAQRSAPSSTASRRSSVPAAILRRRRFMAARSSRRRSASGAARSRCVRGRWTPPSCTSRALSPRSTEKGPLRPVTSRGARRRSRACAATHDRPARPPSRSSTPSRPQAIPAAALPSSPPTTAVRPSGSSATRRLRSARCLSALRRSEPFLGERAQILNSLGTLYVTLGAHGAAEALLEHAAELHRRRGDSVGEAIACGQLGAAALGLGALERARAPLQRQEWLCARLGDAFGARAPSRSSRSSRSSSAAPTTPSRWRPPPATLPSAPRRRSEPGSLTLRGRSGARGGISAIRPRRRRSTRRARSSARSAFRSERRSPPGIAPRPRRSRPRGRRTGSPPPGRSAPWVCPRGWRSSSGSVWKSRMRAAPGDGRAGAGRRGPRAGACRGGADVASRGHAARGRRSFTIVPTTLPRSPLAGRRLSATWVGSRR